MFTVTLDDDRLALVKRGVPNLKIGDLYGAVGSEHALEQIDPTTGLLTPVLTGLIGPHGIVFVSDVPEPETYAMLLAGLGLVGFVVRRRETA